MIREGLEGIDGLVCDLDGVIYRGEVPIEGAAAAIGRLRAMEVRVVFCTNNSRSTITRYVERLRAVGVEASPADIVTSAIVTAEVVHERGFSGKTAIVVGGDGIRAALGDVCVSVKDDSSVTKADLVVVGWDPGFDYEAMKRAADAVRDGAVFIATNDDASFPAPQGLWPGAGAILASIETASGRKAEVMGKPHAPMLDHVGRRLEGCERIAIVGDRPETDLAGAAERGWQTVLVLSGVTTAVDAPKVSPRPDLTIESLADLVD
jgi:4-nitrophenyl phosphatase